MIHFLFHSTISPTILTPCSFNPFIYVFLKLFRQFSTPTPSSPMIFYDVKMCVESCFEGAFAAKTESRMAAGLAGFEIMRGVNGE